ncbi:hypothetical protein AVEN_22570-1 [Araneus ventricosus]|uniref:Uncharacterized protein n=1 Tax=Araneus ventricosus TaxID=182803 RepID=A0A4Y2E7C4_ARAVE|nr:hypothetical protein AVEN_22570-1 [Araneus ventricosus]
MVRRIFYDAFSRMTSCSLHGHFQLGKKKPDLTKLCREIRNPEEAQAFVFAQETLHQIRSMDALSRWRCQLPTCPQDPHLVHVEFISGCLGPVGTRFTRTLVWPMKSSFMDVEDLPQLASLSNYVRPSFEMVVLVVCLSGPRCFVLRNLLNLADRVHLSIFNLKVMQQGCFSHFVKGESFNGAHLRTLPSAIGYLLTTDCFCRQGKNQACSLR